MENTKPGGVKPSPPLGVTHSSANTTHGYVDLADAMTAAATNGKPIPPAAPPKVKPEVKPSIFDRLRGVRAKRVESHRQVYIRLLQKSIAGGELSEKELGEWATAMDLAGITDADLQAHRKLATDLATARAAKAAVPAAKAAHDAATENLNKVQAEILALNARRDVLASAARDRGWEFSTLNSGAAPLLQLEKKYRELFGD